MLSPTSVKSNYLKCLQSNFLSFYLSKKALVLISEQFPPFEVRYCPALVAKKAEVSVNRPIVGTLDSKPRNPFLPFDKNLLVSELNSDFILIFNKFCVVPEHLLIITKEFVEQSAEYSGKDFQVVRDVLMGLKDLRPMAFYNSGPEAGASQIHRHFQVIPTENIPIEAHIESVDKFDEPFTIPLYSSFVHACIRRNSDAFSNDWHFEAYHKLKSACLKENGVFGSFSFNLIWTLDWVLFVPRSREFTLDGMNSLNAMAFAGYFLLMSEDDLECFNVIKALEEVTIPVQ